MERAKKTITIFFMIGVMFITSLSFVRADEKVIRVGFPIQAGLTEKDEQGNYSGYTYDYLKEIAQYTGWTYEFVEIEGEINDQLLTLLDMLEKGEIDLLGGMNYNEALQEIYDFPSENYGNAYSVIATMSNQSEIDEYNISDHKEFRIALQEKAVNRNELFFQYATLNDINYEVVWCESGEEQEQIVREGKADALLSVNLGIADDMRSIVKFSPTPFYFATTKGNSYIVSELNQAITYISEVYPTLQSELYNRYFNKQVGTINLNSKEQAYVQEHPTLKVLVHDGFGPLEYYDQNHEIQGVAKDILQHIAEKVGWELQYVYADSYEMYENAIANDEVDLVLSVDYDYDSGLKKEMLLSNPYLETEKVIVAHEGVNVANLEGKVQAAYKGEKMQDSEYIHYFDSIEAMLNAVENGECDFAYSNSYAASYYQYRNHFEHTIIFPRMAGETVRYSIGIVDRDEKVLSTIINKGVRSIESSLLEGYIYNHAQQNQDSSLLAFMRDNPLMTISFIMVIALFVLAILFFYYKEKLKMNRKLELENTRYRYLSNMMSEITFTYDYGKDMLILSKEGQNLFETSATIERYIETYKSKVIFAQADASLKNLLLKKQDVDEEMEITFPHQEKQWYHLIIKVIYDQNKAVSAVGRFQNINEEKIEKEELLETSRLDGLTEILNSSTMKKEVAEWNKYPDMSYAFAILDLDDFKSVNDTYGHYVGDQVLIEIAKAMKEVFKKDALLGRLGGDEFAIYVNYEDKNRLMEQMEMLIQELHYVKGHTEVPIPTISIGISFYHCGDDFSSLYQRADIMLYKVKNDGKNDIRMEEA